MSDILRAGKPRAEEAPTIPALAGLRALSASQHSVWLAEVLYRDTPRWTQVTVLRLDGAVDLDRLEDAVQAGFEYYPALRTRVLLDGTTPRQHFVPPYRLPVRRERLESDVAAVDLWLKQASAQTFILYDEPLFRADLLLLGPDSYALVLQVHHLAVDGIGCATLVARIAAAYRGDVPMMSEESQAYPQWLDRQELRGPEFEDAVAVFRRELTGASVHDPALYDQPDLGEFYDPPHLPESKHAFDLPTSQALHRLARVNQATPFIVFLAAYASALAEVVGSDDLVITTFVSGRHREPPELVGMCINTLLVRLRLDRRVDGTACIAAAKSAWSRVRRLQNVPLAALHAAGGGAIPAAAQYAINYLDMLQVPFDLPGVRTQVTHAQQGFPPNDLLFYVLREQDECIRMRLINGAGIPALSQKRLDELLSTIVRTLGSWLTAAQA